MKTAQESASKYASRSASASSDYVNGVQTSTKDQNQAAIAAADIHKQATMAALNDGRYAAGLRKAGRQSYIDGVTKKGGGRYGEGVADAAPKYATESARFDGARNAASSISRGIKGSPQNLQRVAAVVNAQIAAKKTK